MAASGTDMSRAYRRLVIVIERVCPALPETDLLPSAISSADTTVAYAVTATPGARVETRVVDVYDPGQLSEYTWMCSASPSTPSVLSTLTT